MLIPLGEWLPDLPVLNNPGVLTAINVIPGPTDTYLPFPDLNRVATSNAGTMLGAVSVRDNANNTYIYTGNASATYRQVGMSLTAATRLVGGAYNTLTDDAWEFVSWGQTVIAVNGNDTPQQISLGAANFADLSSMPKARHIAVIKDFVVIGNVSDSAAQVQRVRWSAINNSSLWSVDATTLADFQDLPGDGGWVQKVVSGEQGYVFQERAIWRMTFVGSPLIFQFDKVQDGIGAYAPQSVVSYKNMMFFLSAEGFVRFDGSNITPIGNGKVDNTFFADLDQNYLSKVRGVIVPDRKIVLWSYPGVGNSGGLSNHILVYSWAYDRWAFVEGTNGNLALDLIFQATTIGYTLDGLDAVSSSIDALAFSLDSRAWTGGQLQFAAFNNGDLYYFNGTPMDTFVQSREVNLMTMQSGQPLRNKSAVREIWPVMQGGDRSAVAISMQYRDIVTLDEVDSGDISVTSAGFAQVRITSRYQRFGIATTGDFEFIQGFDVDFVDAGER